MRSMILTHRCRRFLFCVWLVGAVCVPQGGQAETPSPQVPTALQLPDNTRLELTDAAIRRVHASSDSQADAAIWSIAAKQAQLPLLFENTAGEPLLFYFVAEGDNFGEFHATRIEDGREQWRQPVWSSSAADSPVSAVFATPWIYIGHGFWLEQIDPDDGRIVERFLARTAIQSLRLLPEGGLEIQRQEDYEDVQPLLTFQNGRFHPQIAAPANLVLSLSIWKRAQRVMEDFDANYLDLYRLRRRDQPPLSPEAVLMRREFDLGNAEQAYRAAYQADPTNPAFALYLALTLHYQQRHAEADIYRRAALATSEPFWEVSLHLGGFVCEALQLTAWADEFYAQGIRRYFQDVPAPGEWAVLIDVLIQMSGQRNAAAGPFERAIEILELRRQIFPYTEFDNHFSREYVRILRQKGLFEQAERETQRVGRVEFFSDFPRPTPYSFLGFLIMSVLIGGLLVCCNETRHWREWPIVLLMIGGIVGIMFAPYPLTPFSDNRKLLIIPIIVLVYLGSLTFLRRRRESTPLPIWRMMSHLALSSYLVLMAAVHVAYLLGMLLSGSPIGGKVGEAFLIILWILAYRWHKRQVQARPFRYAKTVLALWALIWGQLAWMHYYVEIVGIEAAMLLPSYSYGHPNWNAWIDPHVQNARYASPDLTLMQAVIHHLGEDDVFARRIYQTLPHDARALNNLGVMSWQADPALARRYFEQARELDAGCAPALYNLGVFTHDSMLIEQAAIHNPWRVNAYQTHAPGKPWIAAPTLREWSHGVYWSQGGFPVRGFTEIAVAVENQWFVLFSWLRPAIF